jgi:hypothetical protein
MLRADRNRAMGVLFRGAIVVATIFAVSPMHEEGLLRVDDVRTTAATSAQRVTEAALALCGEDRMACIARLTDQIGRVMPRTEAGAKRPEPPLPVPRPAGFSPH